MTKNCKCDGAPCCEFSGSGDKPKVEDDSFAAFLGYD